MLSQITISHLKEIQAAMAVYGIPGYGMGVDFDPEWEGALSSLPPEVHHVQEFDPELAWAAVVALSRGA